MIRSKIIFTLAALTLLLAACTAGASPAPTLEPTSVPSAVPTALIADTPAATQPGLPQTEADVPRVSVEEAAAAIKSGEAVVVDVRSAEAYQQSHIPGALSVPLFNIEQNPAGVGLDKDKWIITYCT